MPEPAMLPGFGVEPLPECPDCGAVGYPQGHQGCWSVRRIVGRTDPETSVDAAERMVVSGRLTDHEGWLFRLVMRWPGNTLPELARLVVGDAAEMQDAIQRLGAEADAGQIRMAFVRRAAELVRKGRLEWGAARDGCRTLHPRRLA